MRRNDTAVRSQRPFKSAFWSWRCCFSYRVRPVPMYGFAGSPTPIMFYTRVYNIYSKECKL